MTGGARCTARPGWRVPEGRSSRGSAGRLTLDKLILCDGQLGYRAHVDDETCLVRLDTSAVLALADHKPNEDFEAMLDARRGVIRAAAQRLYDQGFYAVTESGIEVRINGTDLSQS